MHTSHTHTTATPKDIYLKMSFRLLIHYPVTLSSSIDLSCRNWLSFLLCNGDVVS